MMYPLPRVYLYFTCYSLSLTFLLSISSHLLSHSAGVTVFSITARVFQSFSSSLISSSAPFTFLLTSTICQCKCWQTFNTNQTIFLMHTLGYYSVSKSCWIWYVFNNYAKYQQQCISPLFKAWFALVGSEGKWKRWVSTLTSTWDQWVSRTVTSARGRAPVSASPTTPTTRLAQLLIL